MGGNHFTMMKGEHVSCLILSIQLIANIFAGCYTRQAHPEGSQALSSCLPGI